ncbi:MAG: 2-amino-4-hydroxy-6-hydroxymethyldihydropteridine diphosphokinase [Hydrogenobacter sp.]
MAICYISFGSNFGDRLENILKALTFLTKLGKIEAVSTIYESPPWGVTDQPNFLNGVLRLNTNLKPIALLRELKRIEKSVGRIKRYRWGPREIDLDILLYEQYVIMLSFLRIPHRHLLERDFFLFPLLELDDNLLYPITREPLKLLAKKVKNQLKPYACITSYLLYTAPNSRV